MQQMMSVEELQLFMEREFPQVAGRIRLEECRDGRAVVRMRIGDDELRPGGTVSGPTIFMLADVSIYLLVLSAIGPRALAVTTNSSIDFMRRPEPVDLVAEARLLKLGRRLAVGDVLVYSAAQAQPVARAAMTYSIPDR